MTEYWWLRCDDPYKLGEALTVGRGDAFPNPNSRLNSRLTRLLACALCRQVWDKLSKRGKHIVRVCENYADKQGMKGYTVEKLNKLRDKIKNDTTIKAGTVAFLPFYLCHETIQLLDFVCPKLASGYDGNDIRKGWGLNTPLIQSNIVREIVGNPFREIQLFPYWKTVTVMDLANVAYLSGDSSILPILADALEEAGCGNEILEHLRQNNTPHYKGCWALDLILGRREEISAYK